MLILERKALIVGFIVLILITIGAIVFLYRPKIAARAKMRQEAVELKDKIAEMRRLAKEIEKLKIRILQLEEEEREFVAKIVPRAEVLALTKQLSEEAKRYNLRFLSIRPPGLDTLLLKETHEVPLRPIPFEITLHGKYLDIGRFVGALRNFPYFIKVYELEFMGKDDIRPMIEARILVNIFASSLTMERRT